MKKDRRMKVQKSGAAQMDKLVAAMADNTLMIKVTVGGWGGTVTDGSSSAILADHYKGTVQGFQNARLNILPPDIKAEWTKAKNKICAIWSANTVKFGDDGYGLMLSKIYPECRGLIDTAIAEAQQVADKTVGRIPEIERWAKDNLKNAYKPDMVPSADEIRHGLKAKVTTRAVGLPVKCGDLSSEDVENIKKQMSEELAGTYKKAVMELLGEVKETIQQSVKRMGEAKQKSTRYDGTISTLGKLLSKINNMNVMEDEEIKALVELIIDNMSCLEDGRSIRTDENARKEAKVKATKVLQSLEGFTL